MRAGWRKARGDARERKNGEGLTVGESRAHLSMPGFRVLLPAAFLFAAMLL
jgi:hypothetical protein